MTHSDRLLGALALLVAGFGLGLFLYSLQPDVSPLLQPYRAAWPKAVQRLSLDQARRLWEQGATFVDAREPETYALGHIPRAVNLPAQPLPSEQTVGVVAGLQPHLPLVLYCDTDQCGAARHLAGWISQRKLALVAVFDEGWQGWRQSGAPVSYP